MQWGTLIDARLLQQEDVGGTLTACSTSIPWQRGRKDVVLTRLSRLGKNKKRRRDRIPSCTKQFDIKKSEVNEVPFVAHFTAMSYLVDGVLFYVTHFHSVHH